MGLSPITLSDLRVYAAPCASLASRKPDGRPVLTDGDTMTEPATGATDSAGMRLLGLVDTEDPYNVDDAEILPCRSGRAGGVRADAPPDPNA